MYTLDVVLDPRKAIEKLENEQYDLILLDVLMTGDKTLAGSKEYEELGCSDYITKPFLPLLIKEVIHNVCCDMAEVV